ncbi:IQ motif and Sec7 domain ArfGEF 3 [Phyllostomus discolor]|uniref:IQ motif and Sec7 domain ArfGEF 3 n=1 Tax=Phyllostomus discolor TaxID=89673 RepID=A0A834AV70_9CHIR|nr:IQ motif and Sec7 domain ArfGEF 3 [Phyllostomus discolor]
MESLLENPVRAVLYLKELTAIVQNQQSLIHTQRQRIDELERRLDELSAENRSLWEHQQLLQAQPPPGLVPPSPTPLPAIPAAAVAQEQLQNHGQLLSSPPQTAPEQPPLQHHGQFLVQPPPGPSTRAHAPQSPHQHPVAPGAVANKEKERSPSCCAAAGTLLQHKSPAALSKGVLSRRTENETVLHQFCCPAADAEQKPSCADLASHRCAVIGGWSSPPHLHSPAPQSKAHTIVPFGLFLLGLVFLLICFFYLLPHTSVFLCFLWTPDEPFRTFEDLIPFCSNPKSMLLLSKWPI